MAYIANDKQNISVTPSHRKDELILSIWRCPLSLGTILSKQEARELADILYEAAGEEDDGYNPNQKSLPFPDGRMAA